jgi:predicted ATPase
MTMLLLRDVESCRAVADELYPLAERNKFGWQLADAIFLRGWLAAVAGDYGAGIEQMAHGVMHPFLAQFRPVYLPLLAEQELRAGRLDAAMAPLDRADAEAEQYENHFCEPESVRVRAEVLLAQSRANEAEALFRKAVAVAVRQPCRPLELRAATGLARLMSDSGRRSEAQALLAPIYSSFTEGLARPDLQAAKALLDDLG